MIQGHKKFVFITSNLSDNKRIERIVASAVIHMNTREKIKLIEPVKTN